MFESVDYTPYNNYHSHTQCPGQPSSCLHLPSLPAAQFFLDIYRNLILLINRLSSFLDIDCIRRHLHLGQDIAQAVNSELQCHIFAIGYIQPLQHHLAVLVTFQECPDYSAVCRLRHRYQSLDEDAVSCSLHRHTARHRAAARPYC